ncbi:uncharacterized protein LOC103934301 isoform X1 [Pyrus x bretschneideri]|uniref:uncharacterized protein LOC103934301 isoform X1 n=1 Tax=Pyrus x bretschneideri TaxID=225117 RepID=UPI00202FE9A5|nr:uncharacterized protein LOC103934301 isoform X1 [Pyrus x bretschneideri]XP_009342340.2 uncharacterized protein LOC103934301 isoform X1 [Pyrus x bretschneideri]XP_009342347.2 uncharacterized protein LOC103934301 isoform X1 [Pyrus x bretschneideri]XP_048423535.1 uncharacterized protein LOC103934301 isoform X1 [Pyrus x bretschneideri]
MDLTDQQLKPCKCGYEVCVWCWHHIMEMAVNDGKEGRCPLCRTPYDKEKIVGVAANCQKLVAEINVKRKQKKPKGSEVKKQHLTDVRVLQRTLVYVIGIPLNLASEDLLKRREYFGQYGRVLKVSVSRTANGAIQQAPNNSCCVYVSYSKEYEAARCIQSVHSFVLDGRCLRASFGTTKYCHAWLKSVPCNNPDCWYLHDFGSQEDSFTKDELLSAFERSKDHQNIGVTNNLNRHSVKGLPPPTAENSKAERSSATNHPSNITGNEVKSYRADGDPRTSIPAIAPWVMQVTPSVPPATSSPGSERPLYQNPEKSSDLHPLSSEVVRNESSTHSVRSEESHEWLMTEQVITKNGQAAISNTTSGALAERAPVSVTSNKNLCCPSPNNGIERGSRATSTNLISNKNSYCSSSNLPDKSIDSQGSSVAELYRTYEPTSVLPEMGLGKYSRGCETNKPSIHRSLSPDIGESGIISSILTMDLDAPDGSLSPLHNLVKLLSETDKECSLLRVQNSRKLLDKKQSRFSFAQQEDSCDNDIWNASKDYALSGLMGNREYFVDVESNKFLGVPSFTSSKVSEVPRSIAPGFSVPSRAPPPGFSSHLRPRRVDQAFDSSVNHLLQPSCIPTGYSGINGNVEINDPAILQVSEELLARGLSKRANLSQFNSSEPDARLHMLRQQTTSAPQNLGCQDHFMNSYSYLNDAQRITPQQPDQFQPNPSSSFVQPTSQHFSDMHLSNNDWVQWNRVNSVADLGISDLLRNNRLGFNKLIPCYENMQSPTSYFSHLNNRSFEM